MYTIPENIYVILENKIEYQRIYIEYHTVGYIRFSLSLSLSLSLFLSLPHTHSHHPTHLCETGRGGRAFRAVS